MPGRNWWRGLEQRADATTSKAKQGKTLDLIGSNKSRHFVAVGTEEAVFSTLRDGEEIATAAQA